MKARKDCALRVMTRGGKYDYVKESLLPFYVKQGYVVALFPGEEMKLSWEVYDEIERQGIAVIYEYNRDDETGQIIFQPKN